jgi:hypothetical protein
VDQFGIPQEAMGECRVQGPFVSQTTRVARLLCLEHSDGGWVEVSTPPPPPSVKKKETRTPKDFGTATEQRVPPPGEERVEPQKESSLRKSRASERVEPQKESSLRK